MSNHIDPKIQEIERRHAEEQAELDKREYGTFVRQEHQDRAYLLSEYDRLTVELKVSKEYAEALEKDVTHGEMNLDRMNQILEVANETLEWYSNMSKVCESEHLDGGKRARAALSHLKGE